MNATAVLQRLAAYAVSISTMLCCIRVKISQCTVVYCSVVWCGVVKVVGKLNEWTYNLQPW